MGRFPNWRRACFLAATLMVSPALAESGHDSQIIPAIDGAKISQDIATMKKNGMGTNAIKYVLGLDGIEVPDVVLSGYKSVDDAISDGSLRQGSVPTTWRPPAMQPTPSPDLKPKGSSSSDWTSSVTAPTIQRIRSVITSTTRPPNC